MQRVTITIDEELLEVVDALMRRRGYESRSEAFRDILRETASREQVHRDDGMGIAVLSYVFDYETRELAQRLTRLQLDHHDMVAANMRVPLDHASALEITALRGPAQAIETMADEIATQRGVRHANLHLVPVKVSDEPHRHEAGDHPHQHFRA